MDDRAWAALPVPSVDSVQVEGARSPFVSALVRSIADLAEADLSDSAEISVINRGEPGEIDRPSWLIRTDPPPPGLQLVGVATNLGVTWQRPGEPVLDDVSLAGVAVAETQVVQTDEWLPLVKSGEVPLVLSGRVNGHRAVYFTFDLTHSNLVVQMAFPLLGFKLLEWLGGEAAGGRRSLSGRDAHPGAGSGDGGGPGVGTRGRAGDPGRQRGVLHPHRNARGLSGGLPGTGGAGRAVRVGGQELLPRRIGGAFPGVGRGGRNIRHR